VLELAASKAADSTTFDHVGMSDYKAYSSTAASESNFIQWKRKVIRASAQYNN